MRYDRTVVAYHGCDVTVAQKLIEGEAFRKSENRYDWLGTGVYFWEYGPDRAYRFAQDQKVRGIVTTPAVVGAVLQLGTCFDLLDTRFTNDLAEAYALWASAMETLGKRLPVNKGGTPDMKLRNRDCAVLNWYLDQTAKEGVEYDTVRGCFTEGGPAFEGSGIQIESHIQIAVRRTRCILGVFRPY
jgi:hypothetical protein